VGRAWAGHDVTVRLVVVAGQPQWVIRDAQGQPLRHLPAPELSRDRILALDVARRRGKPRGRSQGEPYAR
jgi:hypothetical protein